MQTNAIDGAGVTDNVESNNVYWQELKDLVQHVPLVKGKLSMHCTGAGFNHNLYQFM